jgi:hypothetical protein
MDNIWKNAARKARACEKCVATHSAATTATTPAAAAAVTTFSTATVAATENTATSLALTEEDMNTVEKLDEKLACIEQHWAETQSGPFPEGVRNAIADLRASLERDTETAPTSELSDLADVQHVTTTTTTTTTTIADLSIATMTIEQQDNEALAVKREKEQERRAEKQIRVGEQEAEQREELDTRGQEEIEESRSERIDWVTDNDESIGPIPSASDFHPTKPPQPDCTPPEPTNYTPTAYMPTAPALINPDPGDVACVPNHIGIVPVPISPKPITLDNLVPRMLKEPAPTVLATPVLPTVYSPRNLSALRSGMSNPWGSIKCCHHHSYPP